METHRGFEQAALRAALFTELIYQKKSHWLQCGARFSAQPWASAHGPDGELKFAAAR
jgi:hypothetical protein